MTLEHAFLNPFTGEEEYDRAMFGGINNKIYMHHLQQDPLTFELPSQYYEKIDNANAINPVSTFQQFISAARIEWDAFHSNTTERSHGQ
jgi:hypothetical protein